MITLLTSWVVFLQPDQLSLGQQAKLLVRTYKGERLQGEWTSLLAHPEKYYVPSIQTELIGKKAPDFRLNDWQGRSLRLGQLVEKGPVILIFYYGYWCDHCVAQLFDVDEDLTYFQKLGASVVAVSADPASETAQKFKKYGPFHFDVLSDVGSEVARRYGCFDPPSATQPEKMFHGTFVIDRQGIIRWADISEKPFRSNKTLLLELAFLDGKLPAGISLPLSAKR